MPFKPDTVVVGAGYVGLTLALRMASRGVQTLAVDIDPQKVAELQARRSPIFERDIQETLTQCIRSDNLRFCTSVEDHVSSWILAISYLPGHPEHYVGALRTITPLDNEPPLIVIRSSVPIGYTRTRLLPALEEQFGGPVDKAFYLVSAPERTLSGIALKELGTLPQLVGGTEASVDKAVSLFEKGQITCLALPSLDAAELAKTFTNYARLVQFSLANFLGVLCHEFGVNDRSMMEAVICGYPG